MNWIKQLIKWFIKDDPYYGCDFYKDKGCREIDTFFCDFPDCNTNNDYVERVKRNN